MSQENKKIDVSDLHYYFDAQEKDALDGTRFCSKSRAILALRDRLLALPDNEFDAAVKTLNGLLDQQNQEDKKEQVKGRNKDALRLYEQGKNETASSTKISPI